MFICQVCDADTGDRTRQQKGEENNIKKHGNPKPEEEDKVEITCKPTAGTPPQERTYVTMYYKNSGYLGIRERGGRQILQFGGKRFNREQLNNAATTLISMLQSGKSKADVHTHWRDVLMPKL